MAFYCFLSQSSQIECSPQLNSNVLHLRFFYLHFQFLGKWYEVERTFYLPEIASSCTTLTFDHDNEQSSDIEKTLEVSVKSINHWTGSPTQNIGHASRESQNSSIMDFQVSI